MSILSKGSRWSGARRAAARSNRCWRVDRHFLFDHDDLDSLPVERTEVGQGKGLSGNDSVKFKRASHGTSWGLALAVYLVREVTSDEPRSLVHFV
jgi:hypothetical protein